jgi:hypothetical protein
MSSSHPVAVCDVGVMTMEVWVVCMGMRGKKQMNSTLFWVVFMAVDDFLQ